MLRSVFAKVAHDQWRPVLAWAVFCGVWPAMYIALYPTPEGYLNIELFSFVAPLLFMVYTVAVGGSATAGEEDRGTIDLLLANPVPRWRVVADKAAALLAATLVIAAGMWLGVAVGAGAVGVELDLDLVGQATASAALLGLAMGAFAMALGSLTGARWLSAGLAMAVAVAAFFLNALGALVDWLEPWRVISPFYHYIANDPLSRGLDPAHAGVLVGLALLCFAAATVAFERRDLRG